MTKTENFIQKAKSVHGDRYDYSLVDYINTKRKVTIICTIHGAFEQTPNSHLSKKAGCPNCKNNNKNKTTDEFINRAKIIHGDKYDYSLVDYSNTRDTVIIICPIHGKFLQTPNTHLFKKSGCVRCSKPKHTTAKFISNANVVHGNKYNYSLVEYMGVYVPVNIICPIHGNFEQTPGAHIGCKAGCPTCGIDKLKENIGGYSYELFKNFPERKEYPGILYAISVVNGTEKFIKIGITSRTTKIRCSTGYKNMIIEILYEKQLPLYM
jgi:hypothetical protein